MQIAHACDLEIAQHILQIGQIDKSRAKIQTRLRALVQPSVN